MARLQHLRLLLASSTPAAIVLKAGLNRPGVTRTLGRLGIPVLTIDDNPRALGLRSVIACSAVLLKPAIAYQFIAAFRRRLLVVHTAGDLERAYPTLVERGHKILIQEIVPGPDENLAEACLFRNEDGELLEIFTARKLRAQDDPRPALGYAVSLLGARLRARAGYAA